MAKKIDVKEELRTGLSELAQQIKGARMPAGGTDQSEENQYTEMDMIAGICSAALFGVANRDKDNYKNLTANPKLSYLGQILDILTDITGYVEPDEKLQAQKDKNLLQTINKSNPIKIELAKISDGIFNGIEFTIINKEKTKEPEKSIESSNLIPDLTSISNLDSSIKKEIVNLENLILGLKDLKLSISNNFSNFPNLIPILNTLNTNLNDLSTNIGNKEKSNNTNNIAIELKGINNLKDLYTTLSNIKDLTNDVGLIDGLNGIITTISKINELTSVDISTVIDNITNINKLSQELNNIKEIHLIDDDKISEIIASTDNIIKIISHFNSIPTNIPEIHIFDDNNLINTIEGIVKTIEVIDDKVNESQIKSINNKINSFINFINNENEGLQKLITEIKKLSISGDLQIGDIKGLGELIEGIVAITRFDGKIDSGAISDLANLVSPNGSIGKIIQNINQLGLQAVSKESIQSLNFVKNYFTTIKDLTEIGIIGKFRILTNMAFFRYYINEALPELIKDIDKNFKNIKLDDKSNVLNILKKYFSTIKTIASLTIKDQVQLVSSINTLRSLVIDELGKLIQDIDKKFSKLKLNKKSFEIFNLLGKIKDIAIPKDISEQRKNIKELSKFIFGDKISNKLDKVFGPTSILSLIKKLIAEKETFLQINEPLKALQEAFKQIDDVINHNNINYDKIVELTDSLKLFDKGILINLIHISETGDDQKFVEGLNIIKTFHNDINRIFRNTTLNQSIQKIILDKGSYKRFEETIKLFNALPTFIKILEKISSTKLSQKAMSGLIKLADQLAVVVNKFASIKPERAKAAIQMLKSITMFMLMNSAILIIGSMLMVKVGFENVFSFIIGITVMVLLFKSLFKMLTSKEFSARNIKDKIRIAFNLGLLITELGLILALGSYLMSYVKFTDMLQFLAGVTLMVGMAIGILYILNSIKKSLNKSIASAGQLALLIVACGIAVGIAGLLGQAISFPALIAFGLSIGILIMSIMVPLIFFKGVKVFLFKGIADLGKLILSCTLALILAGLVAKYIDKTSLMVFTGLLAFLVMGILAVTGMFGPTEIKGAADISKLVLYSAAAMLLGGGLFMILGAPFKAAVIEFTIVLGLFVCGILATLGIFGSKDIEAAKGLGKLVMYSALALLIGGLTFMLGGEEFKKAVKEFALTLFLFVLGISISMAIVGYFVNEKVMKKMWMFSLLVFISGLTITIGPILLKKYNIGFFDLLGFVVCALLLAGGMAFLVKIMGNISLKELAMGIIAMIFVELLIAGLAACMWLLADVITELNEIGWLKLLNGLLMMSVVLLYAIGIIVGLGAVLGMIAAIPVIGWMIIAAIAAGAAALACIELLIAGLAGCILLVVEAVKSLDQIKGVDMEAAMKPFGDFLKYGFGAIWDNLSLKKIWFFNRAKSAVKGLGEVIGSIAEGIKKYAELQIPIYDENGKITGYRSLTEQDFKDAATNIALVITTVGGAIMGLFGIGPEGKNLTPDQKEIAMEMLKVESGGLFRSRKTKFGMVVEACKGLGDVIGSIAEGIKSYAELKVPIYNSNGQISGYRSLNADDFTNAAQNIAQVVTTLGGAMLAIYVGKSYDPKTGQAGAQVIPEEDAKEMFSTGGWFSSKTRFMKVVDSTSKLGELISNLAAGIQSYANLAIPTKWNEEGKPIEFRKMGDTEFTAAGDSIAKVISTLGMSVMAVYNGQRWDPATGKLESIPNFTKDMAHDMFDDPHWWGGKNRFRKVLESVTPLGALISSLAEGIQNYAYMKIPIKWDKEGKPIDFKKMTDTEFTNAGEAIGKVILSLGQAVAKVGSSPDFLVAYAVGTIQPVVDSIATVAGMLGPLAQCLGNYALGRFSVMKVVNGQLVADESEYVDVIRDYGSWEKFQEAVTEGVSNVMLALGRAMFDLMGESNAENKSYWDCIVDRTRYEVFFANLGDFINQTQNAFQVMGELLKEPIDSNQVYTYIHFPFKAFVESLDFDEKSSPTMYEMFDSPKRTRKFLENLQNLGPAISTTFFNIRNSLNEARAAFGENTKGEDIAKIINDYINVPITELCKLFDWTAERDVDKTDPRFLVKDNPNRSKEFLEAFNNDLIKMKPVFNSFKEIMALGQLKTIDFSPIHNLCYSISGLIAKDSDGDKISKDSAQEKFNAILSLIYNSSDDLIDIFKALNRIQKIQIDPTKVSGQLNTVITCFISDINKISNQKLENSVGMKNLMKNLIYAGNSLNKIFKKITSILVYNLTQNQIKSLFSEPLIEYVGAINNLSTVSFTKEKYGEITNFNKTIHRWIKIISQINPELFQNQTNVFVQSISQIWNKIATLQEENNNKFKDHVETLKNYVESVNSIDISKVESLTTLAYAVTNLGNQIGNIDKFTNTLAGRVSETLIKLSKQMNYAAGIIKKSDELHDKRRIDIKKSVTQITELMEKEMVVKIQKEEEAQPGVGGDTPSFVPSSPDSSTNTSSDGGSVGGGSNDITGTITSSGSSGGNQLITIDIDENALAIAIVKALKEAKIQV